MCLAVPARIEKIDGDTAELRVGDTDTFITASLMLLPEPGQIGEYVIVHAGFAMHKLDVKDAEETIKLMRLMAEAMEPDFQESPS
ncbi:HypC/HybG/HupF family hydrogenase formation chaperone [Desulfovibrio inopinatus]|uniref:HypC/HybG/HupF family hydrogenase formation chaperone n=1 Tax=Desulfovibrio inopinatus TaxID=102109 RepID=UPI0003FD300A|nr:HypC/HybG/HupF family hydrogenase formation chaperone [Desulfovibrio inopinatus]